MPRSSSPLRALLGLASTLLLLSGGGASAEPQPIGPLVYGYTPGQTYTYALTLEQQGSVQTGAAAQPVSMRLEAELVLVAFAVPDQDGVRLEMTLQKLQFEGKAGDRAVEGRSFTGGLARQKGSWVIAPDGATRDFLLERTGNQRGQALLLIEDGVLRALPVFPTGGLAVGQRWSQPVGDAAASPAVQRDFEITQSTPEQLQLQLKLRGSVASGDAPAGQLSGDGAVVFSRQTRLVQSLDASSRFAAAPGSPGQDLTLHVTLKLLTP